MLLQHTYLKMCSTIIENTEANKTAPSCNNTSVTWNMVRCFLIACYTFVKPKQPKQNYLQ